jgi:hypothetical protein
MVYFCTYFDRNYLPRGLALVRSLREHCPEFRLWVLCMDEATHQALNQLDLPAVEPIALHDLERNDEPLLRAKQNRSPVEYYFTCTPSLPLYVLNHWPEVDLITYLDADLFFFANPAPLFEELGAGSMAIIGHRFSPNQRHREKFGLYNVGWVSFRKDENALACLQWWRARCIEWCYDREEDGKFADQKYLDDWPSRFRDVVVLEHKGANLALWNQANYHLSALNGNTVMVDAQPLIFFHFHGLKKIAPWLYNPHWSLYGASPSKVLRRRIYAPYLHSLFDVEHRLLARLGADPLSDDARGWMKQQGSSQVRRVVRDILTGKCIFCVNGHVI